MGEASDDWRAAMLEAVRRAIVAAEPDLPDGASLDDAAFRALVRAEVAPNLAATR